jgi:hypothetical protein
LTIEGSTDDNNRQIVAKKKEFIPKAGQTPETLKS